MNVITRTAIRAAMKSDLLVRWMSRGRSQGEDAKLDRQVAAILEYQRRSKMPPLESFAPPEARKYAEANFATTEVAPEPMAEVIDTTVSHDRIPVRMFVPNDAGKHWFIWFHGGGGVIGSLDGSERITRYLAEHTKCTVASVGYRLGPEDKHPAAIDDAINAYEVLVSRVPAGGRVAVGGDSFGGYLTAFVDRYARERKLRKPDVQVLVYPLVDHTHAQPSFERYGDGYLLTKTMMMYFRENYLNNQAEEKESPWFWEDLTGSAPAVIHTAGFDPLVDEGDAWAKRLREAGVPVRHHCHESLVHGYLSLSGIVRAAKSATDQLCVEVVESLAQ